MVGKGDILNPGVEYIGDLFHDVREEMPVIHNRSDGPSKLPSEVQAAIKRMKRNKSDGPDGVVSEMVKALEEHGVERLTAVIDKIYDEGKFPDDLSKSIFIALLKKKSRVQ